jgi:hypothetical protein
MAMRIGLLLFALCALPCAGCGTVEGLDAAGDASDTDTDADCEADAGLGDCGAPWGWYDEASGLCWELPPGETVVTWDDAVAYCEARSSGGRCDWRLPTISELRSVVRGCAETVTGGPCGVTDECTSQECWFGSGESCDPRCHDDGEGPGVGGCLWDGEIVGDCSNDYPGDCTFFWSSTQLESSFVVWTIEFWDGRIYDLEGDQAASRPWCVRTGP